MTFIEDSLQKILESLHIDFIREYPVGGSSTVDFFLTKKKIAIEADGEMFHRNKWKTEQRDKMLMRSGEITAIMHFRGRHILKYQKDVRRAIKRAIDEGVYEPEKAVQ